MLICVIEKLLKNDSKNTKTAVNHRFSENKLVIISSYCVWYFQQK